MPIEKKKLATILGYLGLIPFFTFTILKLLECIFIFIKILFIFNFNNYIIF